MEAQGAGVSAAQPQKRAVIVLGLSQHGKTTFMKGLLELQKGTVLGDAEVGTGSERCTVEPEIFRLYQKSSPTKFLAFKTLPKPEKGAEEDNDDDAKFRAYWRRLSKLDEDDYLSMVRLEEPVVAGGGLLAGERLGRRKWWEPSYLPDFLLDIREGKGKAAGKGEEGAPSLQIEALDTPGVEDSKGEDDENMMKIIDKVLEMGELAGIVMVSKCGSPITPTWKDQVARYYQQFPMLAAQWVFVHTNADPYAKNSPQRRKKSSFEAAMRERAELVQNAMREVTDDKDFEAAHIYVESDIEDDEPLKTYLAQQHNALYSVIANFKPVSIGELPFQKGPRLLKVNGALLGALKSMIQSTQATLRELKNDNARLYSMKENHSKITADLRGNIRDKEIMLYKFDNDGPVDAVRYISDTWHFFSLARGSATLVSRHPNYTLSVVDQSGYSRNYARVEESAVLTVQDDGCKVVKVDLVMDSVWSSLKAKVLLSSTMRGVYSTEIKELKAALAPLKHELQTIQEVHQQAERELEAKDESMRQTTLRYDTCARMIDFIEMAWSCDTYRGMRPFYQKACQNALSPEDLVEDFRLQWWSYIKDMGLSEAAFEPVKLF